MIIDHEYFNNLAIDVHNNENKKWWTDEQGNFVDIDDTRLTLLVISELMEAYEAFRKNMKDDKLPHRDGVEVELADAIIRLLDRMVGKKMDPFVRDYSYTTYKNFNFEDSLFHLIQMLGHPARHYNTESLVYDILDICYAMNYDVIRAMNEKRLYNQTRLDHQKASRDSVNGKKF